MSWSDVDKKDVVWPVHLSIYVWDTSGEGKLHHGRRILTLFVGNKLSPWR